MRDNVASLAHTNRVAGEMAPEGPLPGNDLVAFDIRKPCVGFNFWRMNWSSDGATRAVAPLFRRH